MIGDRSLFRNIFIQGATCVLIAFSTLVSAAPPAWWSSGTPPVIDSSATPNSLGIANIGQAKWMAKNALAALRNASPVVADQVEADLVGYGKPIPSWDVPVGDVEKAKQRAPLLLGQLKAIAAPFYRCLNDANPTWLAAERIVNGMPDTGTFYPWTLATTDDANRSPATIGQLKAVFALHFENLSVDSDGDGLSDQWEAENGLAPTDDGSLNPENGPNGDPDGDGVTNLVEQNNRTNPKNAGDFPIQMISTWKMATGTGYTSPIEQMDFYLISHAGWDPQIGSTQAVSQVTYASIQAARDGMNFPATPGTNLQNYQRSNGLTNASAGSHFYLSPQNDHVNGYFSSTRVWLKAPSKNIEQKFYFLKINEHRIGLSEPDLRETETVTITIPANQSFSTPYDLEINPLQQAGAERWSTVTLQPVEVAVDADRDGEITFDGKDKTTAEKPFRFWINDDVDKGGTVDESDWEEDDYNESTKDSDDQKLNFRRDLEDLTRLWIDFSGIDSVFPASDPTVELKVRIEAGTGNPVINLYQPVETDGGREYLKDEDTGYNQLQGIYGQELCQVTSAAIVVPRRAWETLPSDKVVHFLFEGAEEGEGRIIFELWKDGTKMCDLPPVHLSLKKAKDMYETWTVGDVASAGVNFTKWPASSATQTSGQDLPVPEKPEEKDYIMFVHGWNMPPWEKETFASTMFKRMWHQGFKGRFGAFRWPTFYGLSGPSWGNLNGENIHTAHFDGSEQRAWNSASALKNLLINRESEFGTNKIRLYAHSMGNIVSSEALRQMAPSSHVNTYISAQAAISSHVWHNTTTQMAFNAPFELNTPNVYGYYWQSTAALPPHNWENEGRPSYMDPQYMPSGTTYINHYNPLDWALSYDNWQLNQVLKPDVDYNYGWPPLDLTDISLRFWKSQSIPPVRNLTFPNDRFEVFSYAAQSHGYATGQQGATAGKFNVAFSVNLRGEYGFESAHKGHSAQFRSTIQKRWTYWERALKDMQINLPTP